VRGADPVDPADDRGVRHLPTPDPARPDQRGTQMSSVDTGPGNQMASEIAEQPRSEEHTSELQSRENLVCRLLLEKKKVRIDRMEQLRKSFYFYIEKKSPFK